MIDEQLVITGCKRGESWAQRKVYDKYAPIMMGVCMRYANNRETARDLLQEGFIKLFTKIETFAGTGSFEGWIRRIFVTTSLEFLRQKKLLDYTVNIDEHDLTKNIPVFESPIEQLAADDLMKCITSLPDGYRTIFNLYAIEGYSHAEIAEILHIKESTVRSQYARARKVLQIKIQSLTEEPCRKI